MENMPLKMKLSMVEAMTRYKMKFDDAYMLFGKYVGNWGGRSTRFTFEGIRDGKVVKTVVKGAMTRVVPEIRMSSSELHEGATYDVISVRIRMTDENGNLLPFYNRQITAVTEGHIEIMGPSAVDINGGMGGFYIRSTGKEGKARFTLTFPDTGVKITREIAMFINT